MNKEEEVRKAFSKCPYYNMENSPIADYPEHICLLCLSMRVQRIKAKLNFLSNIN